MTLFNLHHYMDSMNSRHAKYLQKSGKSSFCRQKLAIYRLESAEELLIPPTHQFGALRGGRRGLLGCPAGDRGLGGCPAEGVADKTGG